MSRMGDAGCVGMFPGGSSAGSVNTGPEIESAPENRIRRDRTCVAKQIAMRDVACWFAHPYRGGALHARARRPVSLACDRDDVLARIEFYTIEIPVDTILKGTMLYREREPDIPEMSIKYFMEDKNFSMRKFIARNLSVSFVARALA